MARRWVKAFRGGMSVLLCAALSGVGATPAVAAQGDLTLEWVAPLANAAAFVSPSGVAMASSGAATQERTVFVADPGTKSVVGVNVDGTLRGPWTGAGGEPFIAPTDVATDPYGNLYVADAGRPYVYKLDALTGALVEKIGSGLSRPVGVDWYFVSGGGHQLFVADEGHHRVARFSDSGDLSAGAWYTGGGALEAPADVDAVMTADGLRLWVTNPVADRVVCVDALSDSVVRSWGSSGSEDGEITSPVGIAVRSDYGNDVVVSDAAGRVQRFTQGGTHVDTLVGHGTAQGSLAGPKRIALDVANDFMWVAEAGGGRALLFDGLGQFQRQAGGGRSTAPGWFDGPTALATGGPNLYVCDTGNHRVQVIDARHGDALFAFGDPGTAAGQFDHPQGIAVGPDGAVYVADTLNHRIQKFDAAGVHLETYGGFGAGPGQFDEPVGVAVDAAGSIYVADTGNYRIQKLTPAGEPAAEWSSYTYKAQARYFYRLSDIAVGPDGNLFVYDGFNGSGAVAWVVELRPDGTLATVHFDHVSDGLRSRWAGIDVNAGRTIFVGGRDVAMTAAISMKPWLPGITDTQEYTRENPGGAPGQFMHAGDIAAGPFGTLFVSDPVLHRIQRYTVEDVTAPRTRVWSHADLGAWSHSDVGVFVDRPTDGLAGPVETRLFIDGEDAGAVWRASQDTLGSSQHYEVISKEGTTTLEVQASDAFGNREETQTVVVRIDRQAPEATVTISPSGWTTGSVTVSVEATDTGSGVGRVEYWLNGDFSNPLPFCGELTIDSEGATGVGVKVHDAAGYSTMGGGYAKIDRTPPVTTLDTWVHQISETQFGMMLWPTATGTGAETENGGVSTYWVVDDAPMSEVAPYLVLSVPGTHTVEYWSVDAAGNAESRQTTEVVVGGAGGGGGGEDPDPGGGDPPVGGFNLAGGREWHNSNEIRVASDVSGATEMRFKAPGDADWREWVSYSAETTLVVAPDEPDGDWTVLAQYRDSEGAVTDAWASIQIDRVAPRTTSNANEPRHFFADEPIILVPEDADSGIKELWYQLGSADPVKDVTEIRLPAGDHTLRWWSVDHAGNIETAHEKTITVVLFPTTLVTTPKSATIAYGGTYYLTGRLTADGQALASKSIILQRLSGSTWTDTAVRATTDGNGYYKLPLKPSGKTSYRPRFAPTSTHSGASGGYVTVTPKASVGTPVTPKTMYVSKSLTVYGSLKPRHATGHVVRIYRERWTGSTWRKYGYVSAKAANSSDGHSRYSIRMRFPAKGSWRVRAVHVADSQHAYAESAWKRVTVR